MDWIDWKDQIDEFDGCFIEEAQGDGSIKHTPVRGTVQQEGTSQDQENFGAMMNGIIDAHTAVDLLVNALRQVEWRTSDLEAQTAPEINSVTLNNTLTFPFNDSRASVALAKARDNTSYVVEILNVAVTGGCAGDIEITDRLVNGFKMEFTGSASKVVVTYAVIGGFAT